MYILMKVGFKFSEKLLQHGICSPSACHISHRNTIYRHGYSVSLSVAPIPAFGRSASHGSGAEELRPAKLALRSDSGANVYKVEVFQEVLRLLYTRGYAVNLGFVQRFPIHQPADALMPPNFGDPHQHVRPYMAVALTFVYVIPVRHDDLLD
jgi:hypothetical protein